MIFSNAKRKEILAENPSAKITEVAKQLGEKWRQLSDEEKKVKILSVSNNQKKAFCRTSRFSKTRVYPSNGRL